MNQTKLISRVRPGDAVTIDNRVHRVLEFLDVDLVLLQDAETQETRKAKRSELLPASVVAIRQQDLNDVSDEDWTEATKKFEIIRPLLDYPARTRADVVGRAGEFGLNPATLYKWIARFESTGLISALLPRERSDAGQARLAPEVDKLMNEVIEREYLTSQKKNIRVVAREVRKACLAAELPAPHENTVRKRIETMAPRRVLHAREGSKAARERFDPVLGGRKDVNAPLQLVQIDHTQLDVVLVDDANRLPIGRPWITIAIDVYSRMVLGFYVSFDDPGALATGLCLIHAVLPKDEWLSRHGIEGEWPCYGLPYRVLVDNAQEFRGNMLKRACFEYQISLEWRPAGRPKFGGHIERLIGTLGQEIHSLSGTTFSNPRQRGEYNSEGTAIQTLSEFETWLGTLIVQAYHRKPHSSLQTTPIERFRRGILGDGNSPGSGLPRAVADVDRFKLDMLPYVERTIQNYGVSIENIYYYADTLRKWMHSVFPDAKKIKRKFRFRYDPRDISHVWFLDPDINQYFVVPYRDLSHPAMSIWEARRARQMAIDDGLKVVDETAIFRAYDKLRAQEEEARGRTVAVRRAAQKREMVEGTSPSNVRRRSAAPVFFAAGDLDFDNVQPFEEIDLMKDGL